MDSPSHDQLDNYININYEISKDHGFFDEQTGYAYQLLLIGTEIAEALKSVDIACDSRMEIVAEEFDKLMENLEHIRANGSNILPDSSTINDKDNLEEEVADILIRCFSLAGYLDDETDGEIKVNERVPDKMLKNNNRPYKHDKNF